MNKRFGLPYQPYYCEENIWQLTCFRHQQSEERPDDFVLLITSWGGHFRIWQQRLAKRNAPLWWDYHVILLTYQPTPSVYDFDTRLPWPTSALHYLKQSFAQAHTLPEVLQPRFRKISALSYRTTFSTDRSHMRQGQRWQAPPPPWPAPQEGTRSLASLRSPEERPEELSSLDVLLSTLPTPP